ncbi:tRNA pseudouridine synthase A [Gluconacetobacter diazotrophicus PA1 5]|uniref:tRNA pseudouridine synthase A n=2 Tax=Gluconacetobacter diazotrophicus TaxID=33996 RepID=A9HKQ8_GLUDA|nr:tRNA pseudouridine(38-40) synthase TruA [Gluconacetobacter diazotrophicus]ACI50144.1 tRNA pseudouridine synthase A [Gluconacetobacter diazotrophicus PA1 5]MBB2154936.1 tRNA pseudouridine(38-40) synthase TruA [Gluconacetobacter diazotrophicus]TWB08099.1 tRNA pseudouridine38-40 synthase [Gluconacetobacter diazotrophicus]CAP56072.1 putative tRNA pseudouridine synthase A [Gluconacetobacter diazotrophicus PA1 5]
MTAPSLQRWAVRIEYDGRPFVGWQRQITGLSVQQVLEEAASRLASGRVVPSITAGRTDAGVHATGQAAHLDFPGDVRLNDSTVRDALNFHMKPYPVAVLRACPVDTEWSARFSAIRRSYRYRILNRRSRPTLDDGRVWLVKRTLDEAAMARAARLLLGRHDFTSFRASACQARSPLRTLDRLGVVRQGEEIVIEAEARSFLHHQVRNMVGTLKLVGEGLWAPDRVAAALAACDRRAAGPTAPPDGLYLTGVGYDPDPF